MPSFCQSTLPVQAVESLVWDGDALIDWIGGQWRISLSGEVELLQGYFCAYAYSFDAAIASPCGEYQVIYQRLGTKGLLLRHGQLLRELNRSFYHAGAYEYPVALSPRFDGRVLLAHCPEQFNELHIEDAQTGERLTRRSTEAGNLFHSRLQFSPDGQHLLSAGWIWHPFDLLAVFPVEQVIAQPESLNVNHRGIAAICSLDVQAVSACFLDADHIAVVTAADTEAFDPAVASTDEMFPGSLDVYSLSQQRVLHQVPISEELGTVLPCGPHLLSLYDHPKLVDLNTGEVLLRWPDLRTGRQVGSIVLNQPAPLPALAVDASGGRFAVATGAEIVVIQIES